MYLTYINHYFISFRAGHTGWSGKCIVHLSECGNILNEPD